MAVIAKHIPVNSGTAKAWSNLNGTGTIAERDSFNISGYVDNGTGDYTFTISADMSNANYAQSGHSSVSIGALDGANWIRYIPGSSPAVGAVDVGTVNSAGSAFVDAAYVVAHIHGDLA